MTASDWDETLEVDVHHGCRVLEVASLDPPALRRDRTGGPRVRLAVTASDLGTYGAGASAYDPASATGVLFVRRVFDLQAQTMIWTLHRTGLHP